MAARTEEMSFEGYSCLILFNLVTFYKKLTMQAKSMSWLSLGDAGLGGAPPCRDSETVQKVSWNNPRVRNRMTPLLDRTFQAASKGSGLFKLSYPSLVMPEGPDSVKGCFWRFWWRCFKFCNGRIHAFIHKRTHVNLQHPWGCSADPTL